MMNEQAQEQLKKIVIDNVKVLLKKYKPKLFDKMIISDNTDLERTNFTFISYQYQEVNRQLKKLTFPNYQTTNKTVYNLVNSSKRRLEIPEKTLEKVKNLDGAKIKELSSNKIFDAFEYPLLEKGNEVNLIQPKYCFPIESEIKTCLDCNGKKYIKCQDNECNGRHEWTCPTCTGKGKIDCSICKGSNKIRCSGCRGKGHNQCGSLFSSGCGGKGHTMVSGGTYADGRRKPDKEKRCDKCKGKGKNKCTKCIGKGEVKCNSCNSRGKVTCKKCSGKKTIVCSECYGDKQRYGLIDCKTCLTQGKNVLLFFVETMVTNDRTSIILNDNKKNIFSEANIEKHIYREKQHDLVYQKLNSKVIQSYDEYSERYCNLIRSNLKLSKNDFPKITKEEIFYQIIPCIKFEYKHMITGTSHELSIINFWDKPEIILHTNAEVVKEDISNIKKRVLGFLRKVLKTNTHKNKEDKFKEIKLLIHVAKADGKIEPSEKVYISEIINNLKNFTNKEKTRLFALMDMEELPILEQTDVSFSSEERSFEVLERLKELALADEDYEYAEHLKIQEIEKLINTTGKNDFI